MIETFHHNVTTRTFAIDECVVLSLRSASCRAVCSIDCPSCCTWSSLASVSRGKLDDLLSRLDDIFFGFGALRSGARGATECFFRRSGDEEVLESKSPPHTV